MHISTKILALAAGTAVVLTVAACGGGDGAGGTAEGDSISIGVKEDQPGVGLREGNNRTGFDVETAKYVAKELGFADDKVKFVAAPSAQRENLISSGQVQLIFASYSITDDRKKTVSFGGPYFIAGQDLLVRSDNTDITGPDALNGKKLCSVTGSTSAKKIKDTYASGVQLIERDGYSAVRRGIDVIGRRRGHHRRRHPCRVCGADPVRGQAQAGRQAVHRGALRRRAQEG